MQHDIVHTHVRTCIYHSSHSLLLSLYFSPRLVCVCVCCQVDDCEKMQKDVYLTLCQKFISVLGDHLAHCDQQGSDYESPWFQATLDNFRQLLVKVHMHVHVHDCIHVYMYIMKA